ncbi:MAG: cation-translocating P-type ATPase [Bacilli bacterium]|nr:cation-translocating P-type ATPase [Bacilli bacterium]
MKENKKNNVYNETVDELYKRLETSFDGLSEEEANKRLEIYGENKLQEAKKKSNLVLFLGQFNDLMIILLIFAAIFSAIISYIRNESFIDSIIIIIIVIVNALLSFIQEKKADMAIAELNKMFVTNNFVIRNGKKISIDVRNVVIGDIIELEAGDYISADARIISSDSFEVNESTLTGESKAIKKDNMNIKESKELYERKNMVFAGCNVVNGHAFVVVCATGMDTELGKIANSLINKKEEVTSLQKKVNQISKILTYIIFLIIIVMMVVGILKKNDFFDVLMLSISLAVAAIPEGMSSVITIILSLGMTAMAKKNVIIRKMASVETLGSTDVICSDKTGTITENKMLVKSIFVNNNLYTEVDNIKDRDLLFTCAKLCNNVRDDDNNYIGDETEVAIVRYLNEINYRVNSSIRIKEYPFDSDRKMMSVECSISGKTYSFTKGSLESILENTSYYLCNGKISPINDKYKEKLYSIEKEQSLKSLRLLAFAYKDKDTNNPENDMIFIGLMGMMDPPRETVPYAIKTCLKSGIKPIMITGDSINTAIAIAKDVGIIDTYDKAIEGKDIDKMTDNELVKAVDYYQVYARISPSAKLRIVEALQAKELIVAMTGDGVNDAPAIQKADIGIGMGITGTEVVKKVADCILVDDSFSTIVTGVAEGRRITANIKKIILYLLAGNIIEVFLVFISMLLNIEIFSTLQLLWINLITDSIPAIMLAFENATSDIMENTPANRYNDSFFTPFLMAKIFIGALIKSIIMLILFVYFTKTIDIATASSLMFIYLVIHELLFAFSCKNTKKSILNRQLFNNSKLNLGILAILLVQMIILTTGLSRYFIVSGIEHKYIFITLFISVSMFVVGEFAKPIYVKFFKDYKEVK